jgi:hypothetical protein
VTFQTSKAHTLVLFYKAGQQASEDAKENLNTARQAVSDDLGSVALLNADHHNAVCVAYGITSFPTCIIFDEDSNALLRTEDPDDLVFPWFLYELKGILQNRRLRAACI